MNKNDFIFAFLHKLHGKRRIRNFLNRTSDNDFQALYQHLILVCGNLQCFVFCARPSKVTVFNPLVQKEKSIAFPEESFYPVSTLATKQE